MRVLIPGIVKRAIAGIFILFSVYLRGQDLQVKFYLNEQDFLSNHPVPLSEVLEKPHFVVEYSRDGKILLKTYIGQLGNVEERISYHYKDDGELETMDFTDNANKLYKRIQYGVSQEARNFISYRYKVDTVALAGDQYTMIHFEHNRPVRYEFFDVNAVKYGEIGFLYDSSGVLQEELWVKHPEKRIIRRWNFNRSVDDSITHVVEYDSLGSVVQDVYLSPDGSEAVLSFYWPEDTVYTNRPVVPYRLITPLATGRFTWTWIGGSYDAVAVHEYSLSGRELSRTGQHFLYPILDKKLVHGAYYALRFEGRTRSGTKATTVTLKPIFFDSGKPELMGSTPENQSTVVFDLKTTEPLQALSCYLQPVTQGLEKAVAYTFQSDTGLVSGRFTIPVEGQLTDNMVYRLLAQGRDRAGNKSIQVELGTFRYDVNNPRILVAAPRKNRKTNRAVLDYTLSEDLQSLSVLIRNLTRGTEEEKIKVPEIYLGEGEQSFPLTSVFTIADSSYYSVTLSGLDMAGNASETVMIDSIYFDFTPPTVTVIYPFEDAIVNAPAVSYISDERLAHAILEWTFVRGTEDTVAPYTMELEGEELQPGKKLQKSLPPDTELKDGAKYTIIFKAHDEAGNEIQPIRIKNVLFDASPPELALLYPHDNLIIREDIISYISSEFLKEGYLEIHHSGGVPDPRAPYLVTLIDAELEAGRHDSVRLSDMPDLVSGAIYDFTIRGSDLAENQAEPVAIYTVTYDPTPPVFTVEFPTDSSFNAEMVFRYTLSEDVVQGSVILNYAFGDSNLFAPHVILLSDENLKAGTHSITIQDLAINEKTRYNLTGFVTDRAGNHSDTVSVMAITYDITPPELKVTAPAANTYQTNIVFSYILSEDVADLRILWREKGNSPIEYSLAPEYRKAGAHTVEPEDLSSQIPQGVSYSITFTGRDFAGHKLITDRLESIHYDFIPPVVRIPSPVSFTDGNRLAVDVDVSEDLGSSAIILQRVDSLGIGVETDTIPLAGHERTAGLHTLELAEKIQPGRAAEMVLNLWVTGRDIAGNRLNSDTLRNYHYDTVAPQVQWQSPAANTMINHSLVSYHFSEDLLEAKIIWAVAGALEDRQTSVLSGDELTAGQHNNILLKNQPILQDNTIYSIAIKGMDKAGNRARDVFTENITYDISRPRITLADVASHSAINSSDLHFTNSESLGRVTMIWSSVNENNELDERIFEFPPELLTAGEHQLHDGLDPGLQDGRRYDLTLSYVDPAGNEGEEIHIVDLAYDAGPPVIDILAPDSHTIVREARFEISLSEPVVSLGIRISGEGYETYSETVDSLITSETFYYASCFDRVPVREGVPWTMSLTATDKAGNVSEPVVAESITLDITPPEITIVSPAERTRLNTFKVSYINSETLLHGQMVAIDAEGDSSLLQLEGDLLESGEHLLTSWTPQIEDDVPFSLTITGEDPAGHSTESNRIEHLRFDRSRPVVAIMEPVSHAIQSSFQVRYSVSENLESGVIIILNSAERDSQEVRLADDDLKKGEHTIDALESRVTLLESGNYDVVLFGLDYAGNPSDTVQVSEIRLDQTAPVIEFLTPAPDTVYREVTVRYRLSEPLVEGSLLIVPKSSASTNDSTHVIPLPPEGLRGTDAFELALDEEYELQDGGEYQLQITGKDFAGNDALPVKVMGVKIDRTAPDISITEPEDSRVYSRLPLAYSLSENIKTGKIIITQASPGGHATTTEIDLADEYLLAGDHEITTVEQELTLSENDELSFQITCQDYAGNEGQSLSVTNIRYDNSPPVLSVSRPQPDAIQSSLAFTMTASERLMEMRFTLAQNGGTPDQDSPYSFTAREDELEETTWVLQRFSNTPSLKDNIPYTITIQAIDVAGNESEAVIIENIQLDTSPPEYTLSQPVDGEWIADLFISYTISENIANGQVIFKWENGTPDPVNTHMAELTGEALFQGPHEGIHLTFDTPVVDGAKYSVQLAGTDRAGNELRGQEIHGVLYDATPPVLSFLHPPTGAFVNDFMITYSSSEKLSLAKVQVEIHGEDVITAELGNTSRKGGENFFRLTDYIDIVDGQTVDITLKGVDLAGNETVTDPLTNISLDKTTPECVITAPEDGGHVQRLFLNFSISEPLNSLSMTVERTAGKADDNTPAQALIPVYLIKPDEMSILDVEDYIPLNDGTEYRITLSGSDRAGNAFYPVSVSNVLLDKTPPDITVKFPKPGSFSKKKKFEFDLSEELSSATMTWIWTDGREDAVGVHRMAFPEDLLSAGSHTSTILDSIPHVSEAIYNFSLHLVDRAGNTRDINIPDISYDYDAPKLFAHTPKSGQRIDKVKIKFGCNERLKIGRITIVDLVSNEAQLYLIPRDKLDAREYVIGEVVGKLSMVDSHIYQIRAFGMDLAGNRDEIVIADSVIFDTKPPVITDIRPRQNGRTNSSAVTFTLNEPCARGQLIWLRVSGRADPGSPHVIDIPPQYLKQGENSTIALPPAPLVEGAVYSIAISATDLLGNESRKFNVPNITMDMKGPDLIIINPKPSSTSPITAIQIAFSEPLKSARLEIIATGGNPDPNAPYTIDVAENLIKVPREDGVRITGLPALVTGSIYSIALTGIDMAGNPGDITTVEDVMKE